MSDYAYVADRAKKAFASVARLESAIQRNPKDRAAAINLASMRRLAEQATAEMERLAALNHIEVCRYRIVPIEGRSYGLGHVSKSLLEYQYLFSQIYDAIRNGKKSKASIGKDAEKESMLDFAYSYSGSLGVALLAQSERSFFDGSLDKPIEAIYQILDISDIDAVRDIAQNLGRAVVKRVHDWSKANVDGGFSADIQWKRSDGRFLGQMIDCRKMQRIVEFIGATADEKIEPVDVKGMLVGGNMSSRTFHITVPDGETYTGQIDNEAILPKALILGRMYNATIVVSEINYYATEKTIATNRLIRLSGPISTL